MKEELMRKLCEAMTGERVIIYHDPDDEWCCSTFVATCMVGYSISDCNGADDKNFLTACYTFDPHMVKILPITLTLAHEIGHWMTRRKYNKTAELRKYRREADAATPEQYPYIEAEKAATMWGIAWINTHPDIVTQFETEWAI